MATYVTLWNNELGDLLFDRGPEKVTAAKNHLGGKKSTHFFDINSSIPPGMVHPTRTVNHGARFNYLVPSTGYFSHCLPSLVTNGQLEDAGMKVKRCAISRLNPGVEDVFGTPKPTIFWEWMVKWWNTQVFM